MKPLDPKLRDITRKEIEQFIKDGKFLKDFFDISGERPLLRYGFLIAQLEDDAIRYLFFDEFMKEILAAVNKPETVKKAALDRNDGDFAIHMGVAQLRIGQAGWWANNRDKPDGLKSNSKIPSMLTYLAINAYLLLYQDAPFFEVYDFAKKAQNLIGLKENDFRNAFDWLEKYAKTLPDSDPNKIIIATYLSKVRKTPYDEMLDGYLLSIKVLNRGDMYNRLLAQDLKTVQAAAKNLMSPGVVGALNKEDTKATTAFTQAYLTIADKHLSDLRHDGTLEAAIAIISALEERGALNKHLEPEKREIVRKEIEKSGIKKRISEAIERRIEVLREWEGMLKKPVDVFSYESINKMIANFKAPLAEIQKILGERSAEAQKAFSESLTLINQALAPQAAGSVAENLTELARALQALGKAL